METTNVQLGGPTGFIGMTYRNTCDRLLTGAETNKALAFVTAHKLSHCTACSELCRLDSVLPGASVNLKLFQAAWLLISASFKKLVWSQSLLCHLAYLRGTLSFHCLLCWERGPSESRKFQVLPDIVFSCLPSCLSSFPAGWNVSIYEGGKR